MRREGRQHGMVIHTPELSKSRKINELKTVPTTKFMTRVSSKPTNHSRCTTRTWYQCDCPICCDWLHPSYKSRNKTKGAHKKRYYKDDVSVNHLLVSQRAVGPARWVRFDSGSASWILNQLDDTNGDELYDNDYYMDDDVDNGREENCFDVSSLEEEETGFYFVEFVKELESEDGWCLV